jgi:hypothetical protein
VSAGSDGRRSEPRSPASPGHLEIFLRESTLWPVLAVVLAHGVLGIAVILLFALRSGGAAWLGPLLLAGLSVEGVVRARRRGRLALVAGGLAALWLLGIAVAIAGGRLGLL